MFRASSQPIRLRNLLVVLLTCVSGGVDAFSYLNFERVFPANMTGNTVQLGLAIAQLNWEAFGRSGVALLGYVTGVAVGALIVRKVQREAWSPSITRALLLEVVVLSTVVALYLTSNQPQNQPFLTLLIALASVAMGLQSVAVQGLSISGVTTTYITGTITTAVRRIVQHARYATDPDTVEEPGSSWLLVMVWAIYLVAAIGTVAATYISTRLALGVPLTLLTVVVIIAAADDS